MDAWVWLSGYLDALLRTAGHALMLDPQALTHRAEFGWAVPLGIAVLAGISLMIGQSILLAINRVTRTRGALTMAASGIGTVLIAGLEALLVAGLGRMMLGESPRVAVLLPSVLVAFAPYLFGFLILLPYTGPGLARLLQVWHLLALWRVLIPVLETSHGNALLVAAVAWLAAVAAGVVVEHSPLRLRERIFGLVSGTAGLTGQDLLASARLQDDQ